MTASAVEEDWDAFLDRYEGVEAELIMGRMDGTGFEDSTGITRFLNGLKGPVTRASVEEHIRVSKILERDRTDRSVEEKRKAAEIEVEDDKFANLEDTVMGPTPEQLTNAEYATFTPRGRDGTIRSVQGMRKLNNPTVLRMHRKGQISDEGFSACIWYAKKYEQSGFEGGVGSIDYGKEVFTAVHERVAFSERQQEAQKQIRLVKKQLPKAFIKFFEKVVVENQPLHRAKRHCRINNNTVNSKFREMTEIAHEAVKEVDPDFGGRK